jgi:hypothetical protein
MTAHLHRATLGFPSGVIKDIVTGSAKMGPNGVRVLKLVKVMTYVTRLITVKPHALHYKYVTYFNVSFTQDTHTYVTAAL